MAIGISLLGLRLSIGKKPTEINFETREICYETPIPAGWIATNAVHSFECGSPGDGLRFNANVITKYIDLPINSVLEVCTGQKLPDGWKLIRSRTCPMCCGYQGSSVQNNVDQITRVK